MKEIKVILGDCMEVMAQYPEKYFDLAVVDPPYGINMDGGKIGWDNLGNAKEYIKKQWDIDRPNAKYFRELKKCAKHQVIWGANYYPEHLTHSPCWLIWDKNNTGNFADCELAYSSFDTAARKFKFTWNGMLQENMKNKEVRIHPTQKPVALYDWIYQKYLPEGGKVLDTHGGSMSNVISWIKAGNIDGVCVEIDKDYFRDAKKRIQNYLAQQDMFRNDVKIEFIE